MSPLTTKQIFETLIDALETALLLNVIKGYPSWGRHELTLPVAALELASWTPEIPNRIGQRHGRQQIGFRLWLFARHEPELCELLDRLAAWCAGTACIKIDDQRIDIGVAEGQRYEGSEQPVQQEQHALWFPITVSRAIA